LGGFVDPPIFHFGDIKRRILLSPPA
jgi:hypothetical protein